MSSRVGERGQITIEKGIREELAIYAGDETIQRVEGGRIVIDVVPGRSPPETCSSWRRSPIPRAATRDGRRSPC